METGVYKSNLRAFQWEPNASAVSLGSRAPDNLHQVSRNWPDSKNERAQSLPLRHILNGFEGEDKFGPNSMETSVYKFDLRAFQREPNASAVSLGSSAPDNMRQAPRNWQKLAKNKRAQSLPLRHFYNGLRGEDKFRPNGMETSVYKFDLRAF